MINGKTKANQAASMQPALLSLVFAGLLKSVITGEIAPELA